MGGLLHVRMDSTVAALTFTESVIVYSILRLPDQLTTAALAKKLDLQLHEVNPVITSMAKRIGLSRTFIVTWVVFAALVGTMDTVLNSVARFGIPIAALFLGTTHWLAAGHNLELEYRTEGISPNERRKQEREFVEKLQNSNRRGRLGLLFKKDIFTVMAAILCLIVLLSALFAPLLGAWTGRPSATLTIYASALVLALGFMSFFPAVVIGTLIWARRISKSQPPGESEDAVPSQVEESPPAPSGLRRVEVPVDLVESSLAQAKAEGAASIVFEESGDFSDGRKAAG